MPSIQQKYRLLKLISGFCLITIICLSGCGGGGSGGGESESNTNTDSNKSSTPPTVQTGTFLDSAVTGLNYKTFTQSGVTDSNGQFLYLPGEIVEFSIGGIKLGSVSGEKILTPTQMVKANSDPANETVTKILQFLQTLDDDSNPNNGINITENIRAAAAGQSFDFANETESQLGILVNNLLSLKRRLITSTEASKHFNNSLVQQYSGLYQGTWIDKEEKGTFEFNLNPNGVITSGSWISSSRTCEINGRISASGTLTWLDCDGDAGLFNITLPGKLTCPTCGFVIKENVEPHKISGQKIAQGESSITESTPLCKARPHSLLPALTGDFCVGTKSIVMTDSSRSNTFTEEQGNRRLVTQIWYPTDTTTQGEFANYMDADAYTWMIDTFKMTNLFSLPIDADQQISPHGMLNVPLATNGKEFPVIIFSPALRFVISTYTAFIEQLASHGYIVVAINHTHVSGVTTFPGESAIGFSKDIPALGVTDSQLATLIQDVKFVINQLEILNNEDDSTASLQGRMRLTNMGMYGHSLGGTVALEICKNDSRVIACSNMDGIPRDTKETGSNAPIMLLRSVIGTNNSKFDQFFENNNESTFMLRVPKAGHSNFSDGPTMIDHFIPKAEKINSFTKALIGLGQVKSNLPIEVSNAMHLRFFDHYLRGASFNKFISTPAGFFESPTTQAWNTVLGRAFGSEPIFKYKATHNK